MSFIFITRFFINIYKGKSVIAEAVLTSTHNLCFGAKIRKISKLFQRNFPLFHLKISLYGQVFIMWLYRIGFGSDFSNSWTMLMLALSGIFLSNVYKY